VGENFCQLFIWHGLKELKKVNIHRTNYRNQKWGSELNTKNSKDKEQKANKHTLRYKGYRAIKP
jgi:hypothetical protein